LAAHHSASKIAKKKISDFASLYAKLPKGATSCLISNHKWERSAALRIQGVHDWACSLVGAGLGWLVLIFLRGKHC